MISNILFFIILSLNQNTLKQSNAINESTRNLLILSDETREFNNDLAVEIKTAYKSYGKLSILTGLDLNVKRGAMYIKILIQYVCWITLIILIYF